ncbi:hypothetical protein [Sinomonas mesophila]|uniref:hypothetical protein n=1 Tax=Sinomonas mesophila TaxID=1531955 RepID=UPI00098446F2|nr:hypothetical protein [Sinomonas mesophila]
MPAAHDQNTAVVEAAARAAGRLAGHCDVVCDGVIGPWFIEIERVKTRTGQDLTTTRIRRGSRL